MIKVVSTSLILIALIGSTPRLISQDAAAAGQAAAEEAVRREAAKVELRRTLAEAQALRARGQLAAASRSFEEAYQLAVEVGPTVDLERQEVVAGLTEVRLQLADEARARGDLKEASEQLRRVLLVNPQEPRALALQQVVNEEIQDRLGKEPSDAVLERLPDFRNERVNTSVLVNDARLLMEMGKLDEAEAKLKQAVKEDPEHRAAFYYLSLIKERKYQQEARKREMVAKERMVEVEQAWNTPMTRDTLPLANPYARTNTIHTSSARAAIARKLDLIVLDQWYIPGDIPLSEVIKELDDEAKKRDPDGRGINFIISSVLDRPGPAPVGAFGAPGFPGGGIDPLTGQPLPVSTIEENPIVVEDFLVKIDPPLKNVRLIDVLDAIVKVAKPPQGQDQNVTVKYSIEDYAVVFSQRSAEAEPLYTRTYRVDPNTFVQGLDGIYFTQSPFLGLAVGSGGAGGAAGGGGIGGGGGGGLGGGAGGGSTAGQSLPGGYFSFSGSVPGGQTGGGGGGGGIGGQTAGGGGIIGVTVTNSMASIQDMVRQFFAAAGVDFQTNQTQFAQQGQFGAGPTPPQKAIFFNDRTGVLFVRATLRDLDIIEGALQALNITPPQVTIETKFAEISQRDDKALGFDWFLGNTLMADGKAGFQGGTAPSYADGVSKANPYGTFPGTHGIPSAPPNLETDQLITSGLASNAGIPAVGTLTGILTDPQFRVVIRALEARQGVDLLSAPKVTTVSGRQARISVEDTQTIIIGLGVQGLGGGAAGVVGGGAGTVAP